MALGGCFQISIHANRINNCKALTFVFTTQQDFLWMSNNASVISYETSQLLFLCVSQKKIGTVKLLKTSTKKKYPERDKNITHFLYMFTLNKVYPSNSVTILHLKKRKLNYVVVWPRITFDSQRQ